jgi:AraC-like DNA-binding protein
MRNNRFIILLIAIIAGLFVAACKDGVGQGEGQTAEQTQRDTAAMADWMLGSKYDRLGQKRLAELYFKKAYDALKDDPARDLVTYSETSYGLMSVLYQRNDVEGSMKVAADVVKVIEKHKDYPSRRRYSVLLQIAQNQWAVNQIEDAERTFIRGFEKSIETWGSGSGNLDIVVFASAMSEFYWKTGQYDKLAEWLKRGEYEFQFFERKVDNKRDSTFCEEFKAHLAIYRAMLLQGTGHPQEALDVYHAIPRSRIEHVYVISEALEFLRSVGRYNEIADLYEKLDTSELATNGAKMNFDNICYLLTPRYVANVKAGRTDEALKVGIDICEAIDSAVAWQKENDAAELAVIYQTHERELELNEAKAEALLHRIISISAVLIILLIVYLLWRSYRYNQVLLEKNRRLVEEIEQREREERQTIELLKAEPQENLTAEQQLFRRICDLMDGKDHIYTDAELDRSRLAQLLGTNEHYVTDAISACTNGKNLNGFLNEYRLRYATRLLATTDDSISVIAELSGFSRSSFFRIFSDAYGMSPSDYRKVASK